MDEALAAVRKDLEQMRGAETAIFDAHSCCWTTQSCLRTYERGSRTTPLPRARGRKQPTASPPSSTR
jgi:hypothetical protein